MTDFPERRGRGRPRKPQAEPEVKRAVGRPKGAVGKLAEAKKANVKELAAMYVPEAIRTLGEIVLNEDGIAKPSERIAAANALLDRYAGKPVQSVDMTADVTTTAITERMNNAPPEVLEWLAGQEPEERTVQ